MLENWQGKRNLLPTRRGGEERTSWKKNKKKVFSTNYAMPKLKKISRKKKMKESKARCENGK